MGAHESLISSLIKFLNTPVHRTTTTTTTTTTATTATTASTTTATPVVTLTDIVGMSTSPALRAAEVLHLPGNGDREGRKRGASLVGEGFRGISCYMSCTFNGDPQGIRSLVMTDYFIQAPVLICRFHVRHREPLSLARGRSVHLARAGFQAPTEIPNFNAQPIGSIVDPFWY